MRSTSGLRDPMLKNTVLDGTYNGNDMPTADYWYIAKVIQNGLSFDVKGHFTLRR